MNNIDIYIGGSIEHESEISVLKTIVDILSDRGQPAVVLANVNFGQRQIDFVVGLPTLTLVIEAKSLNCPFRGRENGLWKILKPCGWSSCDNFYLQTVKARFALRDAMREFVLGEVGYPSAALVFTSSIRQESSNFRGDFKAKIIEIQNLHEILKPTHKACWSLETWRMFAKHHRLMPMQNIEMAVNPQLQDANKIVSTYCKEFQRTYGALTDGFILGEEWYRILNEVKQQVMDRILLLRGPSGCGKTLTAYGIALDLIVCKHVPIIIRGKDFDGSLRKILNREAALLHAPSVEDLLKATERLNQQLVFIFDGYNECPKNHRLDLLRALMALCKKYHAGILITSQSQIDENQIAHLHEIVISPPNIELKIQIATQALEGDTLLDSQIAILDSVESALEARLVGEIGEDLPSNASHYAVFDAYARRKLDKDAPEGIRALSIIAKFLLKDISFSLSIRDLDRLAERENISTDLLRCLKNAKFLIASGDRVSFSHELYLNAFTAEAIIRYAQGAEDIILAIQSPLHTERKHLIVGAVDDSSLLHVLSNISDDLTIKACILGKCGHVAKEWAEGVCRHVIQRMHNEIEQIRFEICDKSWPYAHAVSDSLSSWSPQDQAILDTLSYLFIEDNFFESLLDLVKAMDDRLMVEYKRLETDAYTSRIDLRSGLFADCYCGFGGIRPAINTIYKQLDSEIIHKLSKGLAERIYERLENGDLSFGQLYLLLRLYNDIGCICVGNKLPSIAPFITKILRLHWQEASYHLRLCLMETAESLSNNISEEDRRNLIDAISEIPSSQNIYISSAVVDALKSLGALQKSEDDHYKCTISHSRYSRKSNRQ